MKPNDLNPLFSDEELTPQEIARARRIVAWVEMPEAIKELRRLERDIGYTTPSSSPIWALRDECRKRIVALAMELFPE